MNTKKTSKISAIVRVASGNFMEMFDFFLYGFYAHYISNAFFPTESQYASLLLTFGTFGAGFLMRPIGAIVLGGYTDRAGRRKGLTLTLAIMAIGTATIAFVPSYAAIGVTAPIIVFLGRLLQGFSAGAELGGVSVYLYEIAPPHQKGFYVGWQSSSLQVATMVAAGLGYLMNTLVAPEVLHAWAWRIPFFIGCLIVPLLFVLRRSLEETEAFLSRKHHPRLPEVLASLRSNYLLIIHGMMLVIMTTVTFYLVAVYTPTFGKTVLKLSTKDSLITTFCVGLLSFFCVPLMGAVSDRIGRRPVLYIATTLGIVTAYPALAWLSSNVSFANLMIVELWFALLYAAYNSAAMVALTDIMPAHVRTVGFSFAFSLAVAIFGGFTPLVSTWLIHATGDKAAPGLWMALAALCGLVATAMLRGSDATSRTAAPEGGLRSAFQASVPAVR
ncbi:MFS transporter [Bordetella sp. FB-8]|uniref:MFS transporter n=1 Tax=Bordetella sp. FB-8 TaxID=1159870 RepID=UPI00037807D3|nr:MFS transporter [Bordetella sp. FB-8]